MSIPFSLQQALITAARQVREQAYAPYSNFLVGAAVLTPDGEIITGVNVENASFGLTVCAERNAIGRLATAGGRIITAVAVATRNGVTPCGACRQVLREFADGDIPVWLITTDTGDIRKTSLYQLLPDSFGSEQLPLA